MNVKNYRKAQRYADKAGAKHDLVHDAYLRWFDKCGKNLFDEENHTVIKVLKYTIMNAWGKEGYMENGEKYRRLFMEVTDYSEYPRLMESPEELMIADDLCKTIPIEIRRVVTKPVVRRGDFVASPDDYLAVFDMMAQEYKQTEIAEAMGCTPQYVGWLVKRIREMVVRYVGK